MRNLSELASELSEQYDLFLEGLGETVLTEVFKERYREIHNRRESGEIVFYDNTAVHYSSANQYSYLPAQYFYIASYWSDYCLELMNYKEVFEEIFSQVYTADNRKEVCQALKGGEPIEERFENAIDSSLNSEDAEKFKRFLTDYEWWHGAKTIDRHDYYVSPILNLSKLVNVNSSIVADICRFIAEHNELVELLGLERIIEIHETDLDYNKIIYGAPGTGKSYEIKQRAQGSFRSENIFRITFHPEFTYSKFVGTYKPESMYRDGEEEYTYYNAAMEERGKYEPLIDYTFEPGPFLEALLRAYEKPENILLVIEEINRANVAEVFGDIFQLLDRNDDGTSIYPVKLQKPAMKYLKKNGYQGDTVSLPGNLYIWASMNSADQGVFPLDTAFKRRWLFEYLPLDKNSDVMRGINIDFAGHSLEWNTLRNVINSHLTEKGINEDKLLGPFFLSKGELQSSNAVKNKLLLYLRDDVLRHNPGVLFRHNTMSRIFSAYEDSDIDNLFSASFLEKNRGLFSVGTDTELREEVE